MVLLLSLFSSRRAVSPLVATLLLIFLSVALSAAVMTWGEAYIGEHAGFARGAPEIGAGCEIVKFSITTIRGVEHVCVKKNEVDLSIDNSPNLVINDFHVRVHGTKGVTNAVNTLQRPLNPNDGVRLLVPFQEIGLPLKVTITPIISTDGSTQFCSEKALAIETLPLCE
ncbi:hypothetical protein HYV79_02385 [Candidatus Woesearchaeota archaeon]|nr:hypothetical protein [Candidatus Woesearchaeota archaeon]